MDWVCASDHAEGVLLRVRVAPRAGRTRLEGIRDGRLLLRVQAPPVEGQANRATARALAELLGVRPGRLRLLRGQKAREKDWLVEGAALDAVRAALDAAIRDRKDSPESHGAV